MAKGTRLAYLSVCSGIESATIAWSPLGWEPVGFAEIDKFPCALLAHHYSAVPNYDITQFHAWPNAALDVLVGGTPCQSFSGIASLDTPNQEVAIYKLVEVGAVTITKAFIPKRGAK